MEEEILEKMKTYFGSDKRRIRHAEKVLLYTKALLEKERGTADVLIPAALLHDIGIKECEKKYNSTNGQLQEIEGPPIAAGILRELNISSRTIREVCGIIASHHSPGELDTDNFRILWDADWLVNLGDEYDMKDKKKMRNIIEKTFLTETGKDIAKEVYSA